MLALHLSDLHFGYSRNTQKILYNYLSRQAQKNPDLVFVSGDLGCNSPKQVIGCLKLLRECFPSQKIYITLGNHDFWSGSWIQMPWDNFIGLNPNYFHFYSRRAKLPGYKQPDSILKILNKIKDESSKLNITVLDGSGIRVSPQLVVLGFSGWYREADLNILDSNDYRYLPEFENKIPIHEYLRIKAEQDLGKILDFETTSSDTVVCLTHFPPFSDKDEKTNPHIANPTFLQFLTEKCDFLLVGHEHFSRKDFIANGCRILNPGSYYDLPDSILFELNNT